MGRVDLLAKGEQLAAGGFRLFNERGNRGQRRPWSRYIDGDDPRGVEGIGKEAGHRRLGACSISAGESQVGVEVEDFAFGAQPVETRRVPGRLAFGEDVRESAKPIARGRQFALAHLGCHELRECQPQVCPRAADLVIDTARARLDQRFGGLNLQPAGSIDRQRLRHHRHVFGDPGDRFAIERDARIRPAGHRQHFGARHVDDRANCANPWAIGREPRQNLGLRKRQRLGADPRRQ